MKGDVGRRHKLIVRTKTLKNLHERKMTMMLPSTQIMMLLHFWVALSLYVIPKWALREL